MLIWRTHPTLGSLSSRTISTGLVNPCRPFSFCLLICLFETSSKLQRSLRLTLLAGQWSKLLLIATAFYATMSETPLRILLRINLPALSTPYCVFCSPHTYTHMLRVDNMHTLIRFPWRAIFHNEIRGSEAKRAQRKTLSAWVSEVSSSEVRWLAFFSQKRFYNRRRVSGEVFVARWSGHYSNALHIQYSFRHFHPRIWLSPVFLLKFAQSSAYSREKDSRMDAVEIVFTQIIWNMHNEQTAFITNKVAGWLTVNCMHPLFWSLLVFISTFMIIIRNL